MGGAFLVAPVRRDAVLGNPVHFPGADLHLKGEGDLPAADDGGVQGMVHIDLGYGDIVLEAARDLVPQRVDDAQHGIAVRDGVHDDADGDQVVDLVK